MTLRPVNIAVRAALLCAVLALLIPATALAQTGTSASSMGGAAYVPPPPPAERAKIVDGVAIPPVGAPPRVVRAIAAANKIAGKPYVYGGGHSQYTVRGSQVKLDRGYDCSGAISFALRGARLLRTPLDSGSFMNWGQRGEGRWITVYTNPGHAYIVIAGLRFDTSGGDRMSAEERRSGSGPRWRKYRRSPSGFSARHPAGF